jgi:chemotaxis protein MotB
MRRRKNDDEHENLERWLITYSDLITLLLAFFIMMYTFSKQDAQKYQEVSEQLKAIFTGRSVLPGGAGSSTSPGLSGVVKGTRLSAEEVARELENEVKTMTASTDPGRKISVFRDERGIVIRIMDRAFFDEGKAELKETAKKALEKIVPIMVNSSRPIRIEGHTDNIPIKTNEFRSNWELSVRRATEVVKYLIEIHNFPPQRISASGYAEYQPVAANDTSENRALNRRIEIILVQTANIRGSGQTASESGAPHPTH